MARVARLSHPTHAPNSGARLGHPARDTFFAGKVISQSGDHLCHVTKVVLPNSEHGPTKRFENAPTPRISLSVAVNLREPIFVVGLGKPEVPLATMPKTAIDKNRYLLAAKRKVRFARNVRWLNGPTSNSA